MQVSEPMTTEPRRERTGGLRRHVRSTVAPRVLTVLAALAATVASAQRTSWTDVDGVRVALTCQGPRTDVTVVILRGPDLAPNEPPPGGHPVTGLEADTARYVRTCRYDPPGTGESEPPSEVLDGREHAAYLRRVLTVRQVSAPLVLVAEGVSAQLARLYADRFPAEVAGLVLVEPWHEDLPSTLRAFLRANPPGRLRTADGLLKQRLAALGAYAEAYLAGRAPPVGGWDVRAGDRQARAARTSLRVPVVVVTSLFDAYTDAWTSGEPEDLRWGRELVTRVAARHAALARRFPRGRHVRFDPGAGPHATELGVVNALVRWVVSMAREAAPPRR